MFSKAKFEIQKPSKNGDPHKHKSIEFQLKPKFIQIQAALYLGSRRLSTFSYSRIKIVSNNTLFSSNDKLVFYKPEGKNGL